MFEWAEAHPIVRGGPALPGPHPGYFWTKEVETLWFCWRNFDGWLPYGAKLLPDLAIFV